MSAAHRSGWAASPRIPAWVSLDGPESDLILSTRVRLARNLSNHCFPHVASDRDSKQTVRSILGAVLISRRAALKGLQSVDIGKLSPQERCKLVDAHLISMRLAVAGRNNHAIIDPHHTVSVLVNEEDHIRIQVILPGLQPETAWNKASDIDDALSAQLTFAFDKRYGFLTSSLANCGTGLRVSVMVHAPALALLGRVQSTWSVFEALGGTIRGLYGEGAGSQGDIFQISNSTALGLTEEQIVGRLRTMATFLKTEENACLDILHRTRSDAIQEQSALSLQRINSAERLTANEAMQLLSSLRLGSRMGFDPAVSPRAFRELIASLKGSSEILVVDADPAKTSERVDEFRPQLLRNWLERLHKQEKQRRSSAAAIIRRRIR